MTDRASETAADLVERLPCSWEDEGLAAQLITNAIRDAIKEEREANTPEESMFVTVDGEEYCDNERALACLLHDGVCFTNERPYFHPFKQSPDRSAADGNTVVIYVNCNDVFMWACADAEDLPQSEIGNLYRMWEADKKWGPIKWCCQQRDLQPQKPMADAMKAEGSWDDEMERLRPNEPTSRSNDKEPAHKGAIQE